MGSDYSFEVKNIEIWAHAFFKHNNSFLATVIHSIRDTILPTVYNSIQRP